MERRQFGQFGQFPLLILLVIVGSVIGVCIGYIVWSPGAANYSVISQSEEATRTVRVKDFSVTFPSIIICKVGEDTSRTIEVSNLNDDPEYLIVSLSLVRSSGVDSTTISAITGNPYRATLAAYGSAKDTLSFKPSSNGYAFFDLTVNGELTGTIALYVVSSP